MSNMESLKNEIAVMIADREMRSASMAQALSQELFTLRWKGADHMKLDPQEVGLLRRQLVDAKKEIKELRDLHHVVDIADQERLGAFDIERVLEYWGNFE